jgi:hypothetical protein
MQEGDEEKINHRIPHRFEPLTNIGANWCCHCGYMLPLGRKNARKCSECDITCHANCAHLVPDFCGMSMETANELLRNWRDINRARGDKASRPTQPRQYVDHPHHAPSPSIDSAAGAMDRMKISGPEVGAPPVDPFGRPPPVLPPNQYQQDARYYSTSPPPQQPQQLPPQAQGPPYGGQQQQPMRPPPGARVPIPPNYGQEPPAGRVSSQYDASPNVGVGDVGYGPGPGGYQVLESHCAVPTKKLTRSLSSNHAPRNS